MIQKITLPKLGETVEVSTIEKWRKNEGDAVAVGDILCEITTDKATLEVECYHRGTLLKILAPAGKELPVGTLIAVIGDKGEKIPEDILAQAGAAAPAKKAKAQKSPAAVAAVAEAPVVAAGGRIVASPRARRVAAELLVDLARVRGTGPGGRIVEADVFTHDKGGRGGGGVKASPVARKMAAQMGVDLAAVAPAGGKVMKEDVLRAASVPITQVVPPPAAGKPGEVVPLSPMRRIISERMLLSKQTLPCYYLEMDADVSDLVCYRNKMNARAGVQKVTFNDFILKACGVALKMFPAVNSRWVEDPGVPERVHERLEPGHVRHPEFHSGGQPGGELHPRPRDDRRPRRVPAGRHPGPQDHGHDPRGGSPSGGRRPGRTVPGGHPRRA
ncbi:MAG: E3 binding domain-containing protein [Planctomycetota bacterium]|nr:E3 binding domain-containing protein [Planctomycetota bacterium]